MKKLKKTVATVGDYAEERNRSVVSDRRSVSRYVDMFYQVGMPFQGKVVLRETEGKDIVEVLVK